VPLYFSNQASAASNVAVTDGEGHAVNLASLTSHGQALEFALLGPNELVAYTGALNASDVVFTVNLSTGGTNGSSYDFVLDKPLDEVPGTGGALNFTFSYTAQDFDRSTASGTFTVTAHDDAPFAHTVSATLAENASATVTLTNGTDYGGG